MTKVYTPNNSKQSIGGGWTFLENFRKGAQGKAEFVDSVQECDVVLITGATMTDRNEMQWAKENGKRIVFRVDNMPKDSRNRGTAFSRMRDFSLLADRLIFQSNWAKDYVGSWMRDIIKAPAIKDDERNRVIYNGVDSEFFYLDKPDHENAVADRGDTFLFVHFNRDENKRAPEAFYEFHKMHMRAVNQDLVKPQLTIVGQFSPELVANNFDFFAGEDVEYVGVISDRKTMGDIYRANQFLYFPAFADAAPNTVAEAMACGTKPLLLNKTGGSYEVADRIQHKGVSTIQDMADEYLSFMEEK